MRELPDKLHISENHEITEMLNLDGVERILLSPSKCYLNDDGVQLEAVIEEIVKRYNSKPQLFQLHHQNKEDSSTEFVAQKEIANAAEMAEWHEEVKTGHPLPDGYTWLMCNEKSVHFVMCAKPVCDIKLPPGGYIKRGKDLVKI